MEPIVPTINKPIKHTRNFFTPFAKKNMFDQATNLPEPKK